MTTPNRSSTPDGGSAFPGEVVVARDDFGVPLKTGYQSGMTLRDYFAAKAMAAIQPEALRFALTTEQVAAKAYNIAAAMIAERSK